MLEEACFSDVWEEWCKPCARMCEIMYEYLSTNRSSAISIRGLLFEALVPCPPVCLGWGRALPEPQSASPALCLVSIFKDAPILITNLTCVDLGFSQNHWQQVLSPNILDYPIRSHPLQKCLPSCISPRSCTYRSSKTFTHCPTPCSLDSRTDTFTISSNPSAMKR